MERDNAWEAPSLRQCLVAIDFFAERDWVQELPTNKAMSTWSEAADYATSMFVDWPSEKCATCTRKLPRYSLTGEEQPAWVDEEIGGVFCVRCYWMWKERISKASEKILEEMEPFAAQVIRALIRLGGRLDISEEEHRHRVLGSLNALEYERLPVWKKRRDEYVASRGENPRCDLCLSSYHWTGYQHVPIEINVHHRTYERTACELDEDLALLCRTCHVLLHNPSHPQSQAQFQRLVRDRDDKEVIAAIGGLLHRYGWGPVK